MTRTSGSATRWGAAPVAAAILVLTMIAGAGTTSANDNLNGSGIWVYACDVSFTVINLTNYHLKVASSTVQQHDSCFDDNIPLQGLDAGPQRTWADVYSLVKNVVAPCNWGDGSVVVQALASGGSSTLHDWAFEIAFQDQHAHNLAESGSWIWLQPHATSQGWSTSYNNYVYGRWATPLVDKEMHNIMTLIGPKCMVALYSPDNKNVVIVVQQYDENHDGWHDADKYKGWRLDWVDNDGSSVPR
jgi:hypothetical protein